MYFVYVFLGMLPVLTAGCVFLSGLGERLSPPMRAVWVWNAQKYFEPFAAEEFISFCKSNGVGLVLAELPGDLDSAAGFVAACDGSGIRVHALDGSPEMARADRHVRVTEFIDRIAGYNSRHGRRARIRGIHLDVEPYLLESFASDGTQRILDEYKQMLEGAAAHPVFRRDGMLLGADIPFWFDSRADGGEYKYRFGGRPVSEYVIDTAGYVCIMAYRNRLDGRDGVLAIARGEVEYAGKARKHIFVGLETGAGKGIPEKTTFAGRPAGSLCEAMAGIEHAFGTNDFFAGVAVHHYGAWRELE